MENATRLDPENVEAGFHALLATHPHAGVTAIDAHGLFAPAPETLRANDHPTLTARSALDLVAASDRTTIIDAWDRARDLGAAHIRVQLRAGNEAALHFFDLRAAHGVLVGLLVADGDLDAPVATAPLVITPRVSIQRKNDVAVFVDVDDATTRMLGWSREELIGHPSLEFVHPDDHDRAIESWMDMLSSAGEKRRARLRYRRADDSWMWLELTNQNRLGDPDDPCVITEALDVSDEMAAHEAVRAREQLLRRVAETMPLGLLHLDHDGNVLYANEKLHEILGLAKVDDTTPPFANIVAADRDTVDHTLALVMNDGLDRDIEVAVRTRRRGDERLCHLRLRALTDPDGTVGGAIVCVEDITERARSRAELEHRATYDPLTGCLNRASVLHHVDAQIASPAPVGVIFMDLDGFKLVNDERGHSTGDLVLIEVVRRIHGCVRDTDVVGRLGGDEFLIVSPASYDLDGVMRIANRIADAFTAPLLLADGSVPMQASIGVAIADNARTTSGLLVAGADAAMYESKRNGDGRPVAETR